MLHWGTLKHLYSSVGSPILLMDDTWLKISYMWVYELLQHVQVHRACDCRFTTKRMDQWSCLSLDRTKRSVSTAGRKQLIEPEPNWFCIRCNSPIHSSVFSSRHTKAHFVHVAAESPFYFLYFCTPIGYRSAKVCMVKTVHNTRCSIQISLI